VSFDRASLPGGLEYDVFGWIRHDIIDDLYVPAGSRHAGKCPVQYAASVQVMVGDETNFRASIAFAQHLAQPVGDAGFHHYAGDSAEFKVIQYWLLGKIVPGFMKLH